MEDLNDNSPKFYSQLFQETIQENVPLGTSVLRIQAFDPDDGPNAQIHYRLSTTNSDESLLPFVIARDSGWITTKAELDRESFSSYNFNVIAADSGDIPLSSTASVVISVHDLNDNDPKMEPKIYEKHVSEQDPPGTPVATVSKSISYHFQNARASLHMQG